MCQAGCIETDPNPGAPGVFLSSSVTAANCIGSFYSDYDQDGLGDKCERDLAVAFAPTMNYAQGDDIRRESYWAARAVGSNSVLIEYQFGYYFDLGTAENYTACKIGTVGELFGECDGHHGDSESVTLTATYELDTKHWLLTRASLSVHKTYIVMNAGGQGYVTALQYARKTGADPIIWVANQKHANYPSQSDCEDGGYNLLVTKYLFSFETCAGPRRTFVAESGGSRNIGSEQVQFFNCVASNNPFYQDPPHPIECLWTADRFTGWQLDQTTSADGYKTRLLRDGFIAQ
ncbi:MAG: hypothetical protein WBW88_05740 [Rhodothermales bacterium]